MPQPLSRTPKRFTRFFCSPSIINIQYWILAFVFLSSCDNEKTVDIENSVPVGLLLPFSGEDAALGWSYERAAISARDIINNAGGINGKPVVFITRDTHSSPDRAADSLNEILEYPVAAVIGPESSEVARLALPECNAHGAVLLSPVISGASSIKVPQDSDWFRPAPSTQILARAFANYVYDNGVDSVAAVYSAEDYHIDFAETFMSRIAELGGSAQGSLILPKQTNCFQDEVTLLRTIEATAVVLSASTEDAARFVNDMAANGDNSTIRWFLPPTLETEVLLQNSYSGAFDGSMGVGIHLRDKSEEFIDMFQSRWTDYPADGAFFYFDTLAILAFALEKAAHSEAGIDLTNLQEQIRQTVKPLGAQMQWNQLEKGLDRIRSGDTVNYVGLTGSIVFDDDGQNIIAPMKIWEIRNSTFVDVETI